MRSPRVGAALATAGLEHRRKGMHTCFQAKPPLPLLEGAAAAPPLACGGGGVHQQAWFAWSDSRQRLRARGIVESEAPWG